MEYFHLYWCEAMAVELEKANLVEREETLETSVISPSETTAVDLASETLPTPDFGRLSEIQEHDLQLDFVRTHDTRQAQEVIGAVNSGSNFHTQVSKELPNSLSLIAVSPEAADVLEIISSADGQIKASVEAEGLQEAFQVWQKSGQSNHLWA